MVAAHRWICRSFHVIACCQKHPRLSLSEISCDVRKKVDSLYWQTLERQACVCFLIPSRIVDLFSLSTSRYLVRICVAVCIASVCVLVVRPEESGNGSTEEHVCVASVSVLVVCLNQCPASHDASHTEVPPAFPTFQDSGIPEGKRMPRSLPAQPTPVALKPPTLVGVVLVGVEGFGRCPAPWCC